MLTCFSWMCWLFKIHINLKLLIPHSFHIPKRKLLESPLGYFCNIHLYGENWYLYIVESSSPWYYICHTFHSISDFLLDNTKIWHCFYLVSFITHCISARINAKQLLLLHPSIAWHDLFLKHLLFNTFILQKKRGYF